MSPTGAAATEHLALIGSAVDPHILTLQDAFKDRSAPGGGMFQTFTHGVALRYQQQKAAGVEDPFTTAEDEMAAMQLAAAKLACSLQNKEACTMCSA